ncbi:hypothetical protein CRG98_011791 [Punica granatum]|uniref:Uncharacterized protein n=1 Tax=Punica granatum TaxID=22663 RepID=A0A2I0KH42_PUNGR|nr:hypothetical protein CRG98_011791 [Punica granatum]
MWLTPTPCGSWGEELPRVGSALWTWLLLAAKLSGSSFTFWVLAPPGSSSDGPLRVLLALERDDFTLFKAPTESEPCLEYSGRAFWLSLPYGLSLRDCLPMGTCDYRQKVHSCVLLPYRGVFVVVGWDLRSPPMELVPIIDIVKLALVVCLSWEVVKLVVDRCRRELARDRFLVGGIYHRGLTVTSTLWEVFKLTVDQRRRELACNYLSVEGLCHCGLIAIASL